jgi:hypothetical protein
MRLIDVFLIEFGELRDISANEITIWIPLLGKADR